MKFLIHWKKLKIQLLKLIQQIMQGMTLLKKQLYMERLSLTIHGD